MNLYDHRHGETRFDDMHGEIRDPAHKHAFGRIHFERSGFVFSPVHDLNSSLDIEERDFLRLARSVGEITAPTRTALVALVQECATEAKACRLSCTLGRHKATCRHCARLSAKEKA